MELIRKLSVFLIIVMGTSQAYIYELKVLRRWNSHYNMYQYFIGLSDFHDKKNPANAIQMKELTSIFNRSSAQNPKIVIEDIGSEGNQGRMRCGNYFVDAQGGILGGLAKVCRSCGLNDIDNIEYRYCRVTSLGPIINNIKANPNSFPSSRNIKISALLHEIDAMMSEVKEFDVGNGELKKYYNGIVDQVHQNLNELQLREHHDMSVSDYIAKFEDESDRIDLIKRLLIFDSQLLDGKMVHTITKSPNTTTIIGIAGGAHIGRTCELLEKDGYELVYSSIISYTKEPDAGKCSGSVINGSYCVKPQPIDISILNQFL